MDEFEKDYLEVERKFEVSKDFSMLEIENILTDVIEIHQAYFVDKKDGKYKRIRIQVSGKTGEKKSVVCEKIQVGELNGVPLMKELEEDHPFEFGVNLMNDLNLKVIFKNRFVFMYEGFNFELDKFQNLAKEFENLITVEVEFKNERELLDFDMIKKPSFIVRELTGDKKYSNANLSKHTDANYRFKYATQDKNPKMKK